MQEHKESFATNFMIIVGAGIVGTMISSGIVYLLTLYFRDYFGNFGKKVALDVEESSKESWDEDES